MKTTFIYALTCPTTGQIRYVGKSNKPTRRFQDHLTAKNKCHRTSWISALNAKGLRPVLEIIDEVPEEHWQQWEVAYIQFFREEGFDLVNGNDGGVGGHIPTLEAIEKSRALRIGKKQSPETIAKKIAALTGKKRTPEQCAEMSARRKGKKLSPEHRAALRGVKRSSEACIRMSDARKGKKFSLERRAKLKGRLPWNKGIKLSPEHCANLSLSHKGKPGHWLGKKHSPETAAKISATKRGRKTGRSSQFFGVCFCKGKKSPWRAFLTREAVQFSSGYFSEETEAARAYDRLVILHGSLNDKLNFPQNII